MNKMCDLGNEDVVLRESSKDISVGSKKVNWYEKQIQRSMKRSWRRTGKVDIK